MPELPIPFSPPDIQEADIAAVVEVLRSGWLSRGPQVEAFEAELAAYTGAKYAVALSSCTAALHLSLLGLGVGPGDEVITSPLTFPATVNAIRYVGATPVFAEVKEDGCIDWMDAVCRCLTPQTRVMLGVDLHGAFCSPYYGPLPFVRDAAHSLGASYQSFWGNKKIGSDARATCFSFYATKTIGVGDGGALLTDDPALAERARRLSLHGLSQGAWRRYQPGEKNTWEVAEVGYKYNFWEPQAALARAQLRRLDATLAQRRRLAQRYTERLDALVRAGILQLSAPRDCYYLFAIRVSDRDQVQEALRQRGIGTGVHFRSLNTLPLYAPYGGPETTPNAVAFGDETLSLPFHNRLTEGEIDRVGTALEQILMG